MRAIRIATETDMTAVAALCAHAGMPFDPPSTLFVMEDANVIRGALGVDWSTGTVHAGPLVVDPEVANPTYVVLRLIEFLELFLAAAGVTTYIFSTPADNTRLRRVVEKAGASPYTTEDTPTGTLIWYQREVHDYERPQG